MLLGAPFSNLLPYGSPSVKQDSTCDACMRQSKQEGDTRKCAKQGPLVWYKATACAWLCKPSPLMSQKSFPPQTAGTQAVLQYSALSPHLIASHLIAISRHLAGSSKSLPALHQRFSAASHLRTTTGSPSNLVRLFRVGGAAGPSECVQKQIPRRCFASMENQRKPQVQETHPGKEHEMDPAPAHMRSSYKPAGKLEGKVALITGGDSGIGRAVAHHFALEGATVAFTYLPGPEDKDADDTIDIIKKAQTSKAEDPLKIGVDLGFDENCQKVISEVVEKYGRIDILVNNAGEQHTVENMEDLGPEQVERTFRTNIFSMFFLVRHALPHMKDGSTIVNSTSVNAFKGNATLLDYTATKGAIIAFTRGLALQLVKRGIRVNAVAPGPVWTPLIPSSFAAEKTEKFGSQVPMGRAGEPAEVATSYVFLASEDSSYFTGQCLHPNGGYIVNA